MVRRGPTVRRNVHKLRPSNWEAAEALFKRRGLVTIAAVRKLLLPHLSAHSVCSAARAANVAPQRAVVPGRLMKRRLVVPEDSVHKILTAAMQHMHEPFTAAATYIAGQLLPFIGRAHAGDETDERRKEDNAPRES